jgi:hypothetical protein
MGRGREVVGEFGVRVEGVGNRLFVGRVNECGLGLVIDLVFGGVGLVTGLYFSSKSLAKDRALEMDVGFWAIMSRRRSGLSPLIKQSKNASGDKPWVRLARVVKEE